MKSRTYILLAIAPLLIASCSGETSLSVDVDALKAFTPTYEAGDDKNVGSPTTDSNGNVIFDFYSLSDFHGAVIADEDEGQIGLSRLATYLDTKRESNPGGTVVLAVGDMYQGSADSNLTYGNVVTYGMNVIQFDAMVLGNHEFDWGVEWIIDNENRADFPFLAANLVLEDTDQNPDFVSPYIILERGDYKVGVIGTIGENIINTILASAIADYDFLEEVTIVDNLAAELKTYYDCDVVVWATHNGTSSLTSKAANRISNVDAIFTSHTHTTTETSIYDSNSREIPVVETANYGEAVAHVQLALDPISGDVSFTTYEVDSSLFDTDPATNSVIDSIYDQYAENFINDFKNITVGKINSDFSITSLANYAVKAMYDAVEENFEALELNGDYELMASFHNVNGGVRTTLSKGTLIYGDVYQAFPFDNEIVVLEVRGTHLATYLSNSASNNAIYHDEGLTSDSFEATRSSRYYIITTDYLSSGSGSNRYLNYEDIVYTKLNVREVVVEAMMSDSGVGSLGCATKSIKPSNYSSSSSASFAYL